MTLRAFADMYCWCCHLEDAMYSCRRCPRTFHRRCVFEMPNYPEPVFDPESMDPASIDRCPECVVADDTVLSNMADIGKPEINSILQYVIDNLKADDIWLNNFYDIPKPHDDTRSSAAVVKFMDIMTLERNVQNELYKTLEGFFGDAKWIRHNTAVTDGRKSDEMTLAEKLLQAIASEMLTIDLCHECYVRKQNRDKTGNWFVTACSRPHLLGWAKIDDYVYWPVKVMGVDTAKDLAIVHSFGLHDQVELPLRSILIYSDDPPNSTKKLRGQVYGWKKACREMKKHLENLEERHGKVVLTEEKKRINCTIAEAVQRMFPDWKLKIMNERAMSRDNTEGLADAENEVTDKE